MIESLLGMIVVLLAIITVCVIYIAGTFYAFTSDLLDIKWELKIHTMYWKHLLGYSNEIKDKGAEDANI